MPPKGWKKKKPVKLPDKKAIQEAMQKENQLAKDTKQAKKEFGALLKKTESKPLKDDLGPPIKNIKDDRDHAKVIISYKDGRGRMATQSYTMAELGISENISYEFKGAKRVARIHLTIDGVVLEKM